MPRRAVLSLLHHWHPVHTTVESLLPEACATLSPRDAALTRHLAQSVVLHRRLLDHWIGCLVGPGKALEAGVMDILRLGLAQICFSRVPDHAAVQATVALAPARARGLVNAVLRRAVRQPDELAAWRATAPPPVRFSLSDSLWGTWAGAYGLARALALAEHSQQPAPLYFVLNRFHPGHREVLSDPAVREASRHDGFLLREGPVPAEWFSEGWIYAQDPAAALAPRLLAPCPGEFVADLCAAPGGKTRMLAELGGGSCRIDAMDPHPERLRLLGENLQRLRVPGVRVMPGDGTQPVPEDVRGSYDAVLVDAPCSNSGVLRRRVDARHRSAGGEGSDLIALQDALLAWGAEAARPGGRMVYATCSLDPVENEDRIENFLACHPGWTCNARHASDPVRGDCDGHFAALLVRGG